MNICSIEGCSKIVQHKGLCSTHYKRQWRHGDPNIFLPKRYAGQKCLVEGCGELASDNNMCKVHGNRVRRHGSAERLRAEFGTGTTNSAGYRVLTIEGKRVYEHVVIAEFALGHKLPEKAIVHHMNENPSDNYTPFNLVICPDQAYHMLLHARMRTQKEGRL